MSAQRIVNYLKTCTHPMSSHSQSHIPSHSSLQSHPQSQSILFASHRLQECLSVCNRVLMLYNGVLVYDGSINTFNSLSELFYQIDIKIPKLNHNKYIQLIDNIYKLQLINNLDTMYIQAYRSDINNDKTDYIIQILKSIYTKNKIAKLNSSLFRVIKYSAYYIRLTIDKTNYPLSKIWNILSILKTYNLIDIYLFRQVEMEDVLALIIEMSKDNIII